VAEENVAISFQLSARQHVLGFAFASGAEESVALSFRLSARQHGLGFAFAAIAEESVAVSFQLSAFGKTTRARLRLRPCA
jgi:hypothetical protein